MAVTAVRTTPNLSVGVDLLENRVDVTKSDDDDLANMAVKLYIGGAGNVVSEDANGTKTTWAATAGSYHIRYFKKIWSTNTTATGIQALY